MPSAYWFVRWIRTFAIRPFVLLPVTICLQASCSSPQEPRLEALHPDLTSVAVDNFYSVLSDSGIIVVRAAPQDTAFRLGINQRVTVSVVTTSGDSETVELAPDLCPPEPHQCSSIAVTMNSGGDVRSLRGAIENVGARLRSASPSGLFGAAWVLEPAHFASALQAIASLPGVQTAEPDNVGGITGPDYSAMSGGLPMDRAQVHVRGDHHLQFAPGDTITVSYRLSSGQLLTSVQAVP
jgi:hypothetical protein